MATGNFSFEKRRREQAKKLKKEAKKQRKLDEAANPAGETSSDGAVEGQSGPDDQGGTEPVVKED